MSKDNGGYVYPFSGGSTLTIHDDKGITRRDWLAGIFMQGIIANSSLKVEGVELGVPPFRVETTYALAYEAADMLIAEGYKEINDVKGNKMKVNK